MNSEYLLGFGNGFHAIPLPSGCSPDFQAGWMDGGGKRVDIELAEELVDSLEAQINELRSELEMDD